MTFDKLDFRVERLEERQLLAVDVGISLLMGPPQISGAGGQEFRYVITNNDIKAATTGLAFSDTFTGPAGTTVNVSDNGGHFGSFGTPLGIDYVSGTALPFATQLGPGETDTVYIDFSTTQRGTLVNTASVAETGDTNSSNNSVGPSMVTVASPPPANGFFLQSKPGDDTVPTFVTNLYWNLLGRAPDTAGEQAWVAYGEAHENAVGEQTIVSGFMNSAEYKTHYVTAVYETFLGRAPDSGGLAFWTDKMGQPGTPGQHGGSADEKYVVAAILGSNEYYNNAGGTPQGWINSVYFDVLGRAPDAAGMSFWEQELAVRGSGDRDGTARDLLSAPEVAHDLLDSGYPNPEIALPLPGSPPGTYPDDLAALTGEGWENLYLDGPWDGAQQGNDSFFAALVGGASWDDVQYQMLTSRQYFSNPNNPAIGNVEGNYTFGASAGVVALGAINNRGEAGGGVITSGQIYFANLGTGTFTAATNGPNGNNYTYTLTGTISGLANGPSQITVTINQVTRGITGTLSGTVNGQTVTGSITTRA